MHTSVCLSINVPRCFRLCTIHGQSYLVLNRAVLVLTAYPMFSLHTYETGNNIVPSDSDYSSLLTVFVITLFL